MKWKTWLSAGWMKKVLISFKKAETGQLQCCSPRPSSPQAPHVLTGCHIPAGLGPCSRSWWHFWSSQLASPSRRDFSVLGWSAPSLRGTCGPRGLAWLLPSFWGSPDSLGGRNHGEMSLDVGCASLWLAVCTVSCVHTPQCVDWTELFTAETQASRLQPGRAQPRSNPVATVKLLSEAAPGAPLSIWKYARWKPTVHWISLGWVRTGRGWVWAECLRKLYTLFNPRLAPSSRILGDLAGPSSEWDKLKLITL